jgi:predicted PurR-regulated permease PerM
LPLKKVNSNLTITEFIRLGFSNAVDIPLVAIIKGIAGLIGYLMFGIEDAILFAILTVICSAIPMVDTTSVWVPLVLYLLAQGQQG